MKEQQYKWSYFENYLHELGYKPYRVVYDYKKKDFDYLAGYFSLSSMDNGGLNHVWINGDKKITYGLNEFGIPATIIYPRPIGYIKTSDGIEYYTPLRDYQMFNVLKKLGNEKTLDLILNKKEIDLDTI